MYITIIIEICKHTNESIYSFITSFWSYVVQSTSILGLDGDLDLEPPIPVGVFGSD
jgi:hypothetical protein